eukprot:Hpha_TRINITY_DN16480_c1_g1::TRINITY_DN16480_c1_g1_i1::g.163713::m.163713
MNALSDSLESRYMLNTLAPFIARCTTRPVQSEWVGSALYGMRLQSNRVLHMGGVFNALLPLVLGVERPKSLSVCNALFGLGRQETISPVVKLVDALAPLLDACTDTLNQQMLAMAASGLCYQGETPSTRAVLRSLLPRVSSFTMLEASTVASLLNGLYGSGATPEGKEIVSLLVTRLPSEGWRPRDVVLAMRGLRGFHDVDDAYRILDCLAARLEEIPPSRITAADVLPRLVHALSGFKDSPQLRQMISSVQAALEIVAQQTGSGPLKGKWDWIKVSTLYTGLASLTESGVPLSELMQRVNELIPLGSGDRRESEEAEDAYAPLRSLFGKRSGRVGHDSTVELPPHSLEERRLRYVFRAARVPGVRFNVVHESGFEMDMLSGLLNIELDGFSLSYRLESRRRLWALRSQYLKEVHDIDVIRLDTRGKSLLEVVEEALSLISTHGARTSASGASFERARAVAARGEEELTVEFMNGWGRGEAFPATIASGKGI